MGQRIPPSGSGCGSTIRASFDKPRRAPSDTPWTTGTSTSTRPLRSALQRPDRGNTGSPRLACGYAFHDAPRPAVHFVDLEVLSLNVIEGLTRQIVPLEMQGQRLEQTLARAHDSRGAPHVFQEQHPPTRLEHAHPLSHRSPVIGDGAKAQAEHHGIEPRIRKVEGLSVALPQVDVQAEICSAPPSLSEHGRAQVHCSQPDALTVQGEVETGSNPNLEHVSD